MMSQHMVERLVTLSNIIELDNKLCIIPNTDLSQISNHHHSWLLACSAVHYRPYVSFGPWDNRHGYITHSLLLSFPFNHLSRLFSMWLMHGTDFVFTFTFSCLSYIYVFLGPPTDLLDIFLISPRCSFTAFQHFLTDFRLDQIGCKLYTFLCFYLIHFKMTLLVWLS